MIRPGREVSSVNGSTNFVDGKYYHFYDRRLTDKTPGLYQRLLASAEHTIVIWDPHYRECRCDVFSAIHKDGIYIEILTVCNNGEDKADIDAFAKKMLDAIDNTEVPNCKVRVIALAPRDLRKVRGIEWHDRYLIIDNTRAFLVGASIDAQEKSNKSFGIYELTETEDINRVIDAYNAYKADIRDISGGVQGNGYKFLAHRP
jgi:hypothetical protein